MNYLYRGLLFDDARHFHGKAELLKMLDVMHALGYNVLHWHISDDQGFRLTLPGFERLAEKSARRNGTNIGGYLKNHPGGPPHGGIYSAQDVADIVSYARERNIRILPEIDMPGHFSAILSAYPEYGCEVRDLEVPGCFGILENTLCLGKESARSFVKHLVLAAARQIGTDLVHIGFDEIKTSQMCRCPDCRARAKSLGLSSSAKLIPLFRQEMADFLRVNGIRTFVWNDPSSLSGPDLSVTMMNWRPEMNRSAAELINRGQKMVLCDFYHYYADYPFCMTPLKKTFSYDPLIRGVQRSDNIIGLECTLWSEFFSENGKMRFSGYYRMAAIAEQWRPGEKRNYREFIADLRQRENELFGAALNIPEHILNPAFPVRLIRFIRCMFRDSEYEYKLYKKHSEACME